MRIKEIKVYPFDELSGDAKEKVIGNMADINVYYEWWDYIYEDAANVKLKLTGFDIDRASYCKGDFVEYAEDTAKAILEQHGEKCGTYSTAVTFLADSKALFIEFPDKPDDEGHDLNEDARNEAQEELNAEFLYSLLEDYRIILSKEYDYLTSEEAIIETIKANEYEFTEDGKLA